MTRVLRSTKIVIAEDDIQIVAQRTHHESPRTRTRTTLGERNNNTEAVISIEDLETEQQLKNLKAAYKVAVTGKKYKKAKKNKKGAQDKSEESAGCDVVLEDQQTIVMSTSSNEARNMLTSNEEHIISKEENSTASLSPAVLAARQRLAESPQGQSRRYYHIPGETAFDLLNDSPCPHAFGQQIPDWYRRHFNISEATVANPSRPGVVENQVAVVQREANLIDKDGDNTMFTPSPKKSAVVTLEEVDKVYDVKDRPSEYRGDDSFVEQIVSRSPAKLVPRIEDSVEELDKMAEIEEALHEVTMAEQIMTEKSKRAPIPRDKSVQPSASKVLAGVKRSTGKTGSAGFSSLRVKSKDALKTLSSQQKGYSSLRVKSNHPLETLNSPHGEEDTSKGEKSSDSRELPLKRPLKRPVKRPASLLPPKQPVKTARPAIVSAFELPGEAVARRFKEQREARHAQREAATNASANAGAGISRPKIKSAKPLTKSTFELPGEAVSRRKREAHETRLKAQEEEDKKRREFKAKPLRKSIAPDTLPRDTVASRARKSQIGSGDQNQALTDLASGSIGVSKRISVVGAHRPSILALKVANISAPRSPGPGGSQATLTRKPSTTNGLCSNIVATHRTVSATDNQLRKQRAKEIYNRDMKALEDIEIEKREREAAARKSREEAAERGRQASREWAEKQRAKKVAEGDKGMTPGFGPGGQIGLKA